MDTTLTLYRQAEAYLKRGYVFDLAEMEQCLTASGLEDFQPEVPGSILTFQRSQACGWPV